MKKWPYIIREQFFPTSARIKVKFHYCTRLQCAQSSSINEGYCAGKEQTNVKDVILIHAIHQFYALESSPERTVQAYKWLLTEQVDFYFRECHRETSESQLFYARNTRPGRVSGSFRYTLIQIYEHNEDRYWKWSPDLVSHASAVLITIRYESQVRKSRRKFEVWEKYYAQAV